MTVQAGSWSEVAPIRIVGVAAILSGAVLSLASVSFPGLAHLALPVLAFGVLCIPTFLPSYRPLSSWTFVAVVGVIGLVLRPIAITVGWPDPNSIEFLFVRGRVDEFFASYHLLFVIASVLLVSGYIASLQSLSSRPAATSPGWSISDRRVHTLVSFSLITGLTTFFLYVNATGGLDLANFSQKRTVITGLQLDEEFRGFQVIATVNRFAFVGYFVYLDKMLSEKGRIRPSQYPVAGILLVNAVLLGIYRSERLPVIVALLLTLLASVSYGKRLRLLAILKAGLVALVAFQLLTSARSGGAAFSGAGVVTQTAESVIENRNMIDPSKTAHIIDGVPSIIPFETGSTIFSYALAPIPRSIWPQKPIIAPGPKLGIELFGNARSGIPPGLFAELYWNFGWPGFAIGIPLVGALLGRVERRLQAMRRTSGSQKVIAIVVLSQIATNMLGIAIGQALLSAAIDLVIIGTVYRLLGQRKAIKLDTKPPQHLASPVAAT